MGSRSSKRKSRTKRFFIAIFILFVSVSFIFSVTAGAFIWYFSKDLPPLDELRQYQPSLVTKVFDDGGTEIGQFYIERRILVPISQMPKALFQAIIAVEDSRFFEHKGVDPLGIFRAIIVNLESFRIRQGASTITQQLARSIFLTPERSFKRKIKEALLARKMEKFLNKNEILEIYLNQIYFGHGSYGVQAAAKTYFGKDIKLLSLSESSFLAGLPKAPTDYSPYFHPERSKKRQGIVLRRMVDEGYITPLQYQEAYEEDLYFKEFGHGEKAGPYFLENVRQYIASRYGEKALYRGGLKVYTTMNLKMQKIASQSLRNGLLALDKRQGFRGPVGRVDIENVEAGTPKEGVLSTQKIRKGAVLKGVVSKVSPEGVDVMVEGIIGKIAKKDMIWAKKRLEGRDLRKNYKISREIDPGKIFRPGDEIWVKVKSVHPVSKEPFFSLDQKPLVQGALLSLDPNTGAIKSMVGGFDFKKSEFNRALHAKRQPGSAFKPIIFTAALDKGLSPASIVFDLPVIFEDTKNEKIWKPENYEKRFYGPISLREALSHSRNVATVKLLRKIGINRVIRMAQQLGISSPLTKDLSLALGSSSVTLLEITSAFSIFANEGLRNKPYFIDLVTDSTGKVLEQKFPEPRRVISKETAYIISNMLEDVVQNGTGRKAKVLKVPLGGKTGTTNDYTDAWFVGFVRNLSTGVWVGFDDVRSLGARESGARAALPIWVSFMREAIKLVPSMPFKIPDDIVYAKVDPKTGLRVPPDSEDGVIEIFVRGSEPLLQTPPKPLPVDFFKMDQEI